MDEFIVDTNVPLVAQGLAEHMSLGCQEKCILFLEELFRGKFHLVIDSDYHIISEYGNKLEKHKVGLGCSFFKWVLNNQANPNKIKSVKINKLDEFNFKEVPDSLIAINFDNSDRKFLAIAIANNRKAAIVQASDSKWIGWETDLLKEGIIVKFLCKEELNQIYRKKAL